jgi:hypothetical protein
MLALYRSGRQADALETFQEARRVLADELGLEPGPELRRLQEAILAHDPAIAAVRSSAAPRQSARAFDVVRRTRGRARPGRSALHEHRLVTLTGPPGSARAASQSRTRARTRTSSRTASGSSTSRGWRQRTTPSASSPTPSTFAARIRCARDFAASPRAALLVLDACEHVLDERRGSRRRCSRSVLRPGSWRRAARRSTSRAR